MEEPEAVVFDRLVHAEPPEEAPDLFETACVLGGSIAGLAAARVLADHARQVVIIERDTVNEEGLPRAGTPQDWHLHVLMPGGHTWLEHWFPGLTQEIGERGAGLSGRNQRDQYSDGQLQVKGDDYMFVTASRPFLESRIRARVLALPNVIAVQAAATGLEYSDDRVSGVRYRSGGDTAVLSAQFVVDAMGRPSKLSDWLRGAGYDSPRLERLPVGINYATARFKRTPGQGKQFTGARYSPPYPADGVSGTAAAPIEDDQWLTTLMSYDDMRPGRTLDAFRETCAKLPRGFAESASGPLIGEIKTYHQADSRRRDFTGLRHFPAGLVSVGDAVLSSNPMFGQGMSVAVLHGSCLSEYLRAEPDLSTPATAFFDLQKVLVDAAWSLSAGADSHRLDALTGAEVPEEVSRQREAFGQLVRATLTDEIVAGRLSAVTSLLAHPNTLADPALFERAIAASRQVAAK